MRRAEAQVRSRASASRDDHYDGLFRAHRPTVLRLCRLLLADPSEVEDVARG
jgi:DNA-directed RNA polymerase specialized sigma24 family protein